MSVMTDLAAWLTQIWGEQEKQAHAAANANASADWTTTEFADYVYTETDGSAYPVACGAYEYMGDGTRYFIAANDPALVLARIAADRQILADYTSAIEALEEIEAGIVPADHEGLERAEWEAEILERPVRHLASAYADRPGFREEWKP